MVENKVFGNENWKYSNNIEYEGRFIDGIPVGQFRYYYPEGQVRSIIEHVNARAAFVTFYYENTEVMSEGFYKDQLRDSLWLNYDRTGLTLSAERFKEGATRGKARCILLAKSARTWRFESIK